MNAIGLSVIALVLLSGCSSKSEDSYYKAMSEQRRAYMEAYKATKDESIKFDCNSSCNLVYTRPKALPKFQALRKPMTNTEMALKWMSVISPSLVGIAGIYYNHKTSTELSNDAKDISIANTNADAKMFESMANRPSTPSSVDSSVNTTTTTTDSSSSYADSYNTTSTDTMTSTDTTTSSYADSYNPLTDSYNPIDDNSVVTDVVP